MWQQKNGSLDLRHFSLAGHRLTAGWKQSKEPYMEAAAIRFSEAPYQTERFFRGNDQIVATVVYFALEEEHQQVMQAMIRGSSALSYRTTVAEVESGKPQNVGARTVWGHANKVSYQIWWFSASGKSENEKPIPLAAIDRTLTDIAAELRRRAASFAPGKSPDKRP